jgi:U3 small nucleolar RNA-associated protein 22
MRPPAAKRRKLSTSEDESEDGSFASFGEEKDVANGDIHEEENGLEEVDDEEMEDGVSGSEDDAEDERTTEDERVVAAPQPKKTPKAHPERRTTETLDGATAMTGEVYKSNMFKLQVDDLLQEVRPKYTAKDKSIERALRALKSIIEDIPARSPVSITEAETTLRRRETVIIPFPEPRPPKDANYKLQYAKPAHINTVGSFPLNLGTKTGDDIVVDLVVTMPSEMFQEKDYLNHRYFYKRAYYLACLAAGIQASKETKYKLSFDTLHGNQLLPVLIVEIDSDTLPKHDLPCKNFKVVILPSMAEGVFPKEKLLPLRNCVRPKKAETTDTQNLLPSTPFYNASLRVDSLVTSYLKLQYEAFKQCASYRDACVLGRIWLRQRGFNGRIQGGGFGNFEWSILIGLLLRSGGSNGTPAFSSGYSSYQLFKATLQYLATRDLAKTPQIIGGEKLNLPKADGSPILFDAERALNVLFKMTPWSYTLLQHEARASVAMLSDSIFDQFDATFILRSDRPLLRYDVAVELPVTNVITNDLVDGSTATRRFHSMYSDLMEGLSDRVKLVNLRPPEDETWIIGSRSSTVGKGSVTLGFVLDPANAHRLIDHGPAAEDKAAAAKFREFWGEKAELRRFRDGSILETVIWSANDEPGSSIFRQVLLYILERRCGKPAIGAGTYNGDADAEMLSHGSSTSKPASTAPFQPMMEAFRTLEQDLRSLEDIPLQIRHLLASDPYLSYSSVDTPFVPHTTMTRPAEVILQFEGSARWPDDLDAIQRTKMAFFLKIAELLEASSENIRARVGLENQDAPLLNQSFLDVHYMGDVSSKMFGAAFRIRIHHDRELTLLERQLKDKSLSNTERQEVAHAIATHKRVFIKEPAHTQALQTLATRFPAFSGTVRLLSKWISSHNLSNHISPYLLSTFAARAFTNPFPWSPASSPQAGFYRSLLFLSRWDWRSEPWVADLGSEMRGPEAAVINTRFEAWRKIDPAMNRVVMFVGSNVDNDGVTWTDHGRPAKVVAGRLVGLAKAAVGLIGEQGVDLVPDALFESNMTDYDFLIHLDRKLTQPRKSSKSSKSGYKNLELQNGHDGSDDVVATASIGFSPAKLFLADLERVFGQAVVFFYDEQIADSIAGLWNPSCEVRSWKLSLGYSSVPVKDGDTGFKAKLNKEGILSEIAGLGGDMVKKVDVKKDGRWQVDIPRA